VKKATIELEKKYVKRIGCLERSTLLSSLCTRRLQRLDKKAAIEIGCFGHGRRLAEKELGDLDLKPQDRSGLV
jgi:hypothetical protein